jgi:hypothetical protein
MATKTKKAPHYPPNDGSRRERTRKAEKCQLCETKVPLKEQFTVVNDLDEGKPVKKKNAARRGAEKLSHYCGECATKRVKQKQAWLDSRDGKPAAKTTTKKSSAKKTTGRKRGAARKAAKGKKRESAAARRRRLGKESADAARRETGGQPF